ncbi:MAG: outer membrane protein transport protein, partial [Rhodobacteraceae bacterium]|nr:outer membrane protein transport protein [Paracoccaceae bacterium]
PIPRDGEKIVDAEGNEIGYVTSGTMSPILNKGIGLAYVPVSGYSVNLASDTGLGYVVGVAYERPDIALRVSLTYNSKTKHELATTETFAGALAALSGTSVTTVETPQSVNLDFQTGVAKDTLVFGQIRWADWSEFDIDPLRFTKVTNAGTFVKGGGLVDLEDSTTYTLGVGHKFTDNWSGALSMSYEDKGDPLVSPLSPSNGKLGVTVAAIYNQGNMKITTGINYTRIGDALAETGTPDTARAIMTKNSALGVGVRIGYSF